MAEADRMADLVRHGGDHAVFVPVEDAGAVHDDVGVLDATATASATAIVGRQRHAENRVGAALHLVGEIGATRDPKDAVVPVDDAKRPKSGGAGIAQGELVPLDIVPTGHGGRLVLLPLNEGLPRPRWHDPVVEAEIGL